MLENARHGVVGILQQQRYIARLGLHAEGIADLQAGLLGQQVFDDAFLFLLRGPPLRDLGRGNPLQQRDHRNIDAAGIGGHPGDGFHAFLDVIDIFQLPDGPDVVRAQKCRRKHLKVLKILPIIIA